MTRDGRLQLGIIVPLGDLLQPDDECADLAVLAPKVPARMPEWAAWFARYVDATERRANRYRHFFIFGWDFEDEPVRVVSNIHRLVWQLGGPIADLQISAMHEADAFREFLAAEAIRLEIEAAQQDERSVGAHLRSALAAALRRVVRRILADLRSLSAVVAIDPRWVLAPGGQTARFAPLN